MFIHGGYWRALDKADFRRAEPLARVVVLLERRSVLGVDLVLEGLRVFVDKRADRCRKGELRVGVDVHLEHPIADRLGNLRLLRTGSTVKYKV